MKNRELSEIECRVLGCLIEKETTTPDYYPLSLNALTNACNQKSNRNPVEAYSETQVQDCLTNLRKAGLAMMVTGGGSRVPKFKHYFQNKYEVTRPEMFLLCELMLRGPQTIGELKQHSERMHPFKSLSEIEKILAKMMDLEPPLVTLLPRLPGQKEGRYMQLLRGKPDLARFESDQPKSQPIQNERLSELEQEVAQLKNEIHVLKSEFRRFKAQFE